MSKPQDRIVWELADSRWAQKRIDAAQPASIHRTQAEAITAARSALVREGGGELIVKDRHGLIRAKDTVAPGRDPFPPRG
jgi:hypothetical protein